MKYILDTNVVSALMRGDPQAVARLRGIDRQDAAIPQPVLAEIAYGVARLARSRRRRLLQERFDLIASELPRAEWTDAVSDRFGFIKAALEKAGRRIEDFDAAIAAHAIAFDAILATADLTDMVRVPGLVVEDWTRSRS